MGIGLGDTRRAAVARTVNGGGVGSVPILQDALELDRQIKAIKAVTLAAANRNPESVYYAFEWYVENIATATDVPRATDLINQGRVAAGNRERETLRDINRQLSPLFPGTEEERSKSYGSGVH